MSAESETTATPSTPDAESGKIQKRTEIVSLETGTSRVNSESSPRNEMPVSAVARLLGVATATDVTLLDGKVDMLINKLTLLQARMDKVLSALQGIPSGSDLERIDVQIGALRSMLREVLPSAAAANASNGTVKKAAPDATAAAPAATPEPESAPAKE